MEKRTFKVSGMKCMNCKANVEKTLRALPGVETALANLQDANVTVDFDETIVTPTVMKEAVDDIGRFEMEI